MKVCDSQIVKHDSLDVEIERLKQDEWEYKIHKFVCWSSEENLLSQFNELGKDGWEAVSIDWDTIELRKRHTIIILFKRKISKINKQIVSQSPISPPLDDPDGGKFGD